MRDRDTIISLLKRKFQFDDNNVANFHLLENFEKDDLLQRLQEIGRSFTQL